MLLFIISKLQTENVYSFVPIHALEPFGFEAGGTFKVQFSIEKGKNIFYSFVSGNEAKKVKGENLSLYCSDEAQIPGQPFSIQNSSYIQGTITNKSILHPILINCDSISETPQIRVEVRSLFVNPNTHFDYRWSNYKIEKLIIIIAASILFILWIINWITHFSVQIWFHYFLSASYLLICFIIRYFFLHQTDIKDEYSLISNIYYTFLFISLSLVFTTLLFAAKGWGIVRDSLTISTIFFSILKII